MPGGREGLEVPDGGDLSLARRILEGDEEAFERLFEETFPALYRYALTRLDFDETLAGEVAQQAMCKAYENLDRFRGESALFTWICAICRFEISAIRRRQRRQQVELDEALPEVRSALETLAPRSYSPGAVLDASEVRGLVHLTLDDLPERYGRALEWKYAEGLSVEAIAKRLETSSKAAESTLTRARVAFRKRFLALSDSLHGLGYRGLRVVGGQRSG